MSTALPLQHRCRECGEWWAQVHCCPKQIPSLQMPAATAQTQLAELTRLQSEIADLQHALREMTDDRDSWAEQESARAVEAVAFMKERDIAIRMLAEWCVSVDQNGTRWDDWVACYKNAKYRPCPIRSLLDGQIKAIAGERT